MFLQSAMWKSRWLPKLYRHTAADVCILLVLYKVRRGKEKLSCEALAGTHRIHKGEHVFVDDADQAEAEQVLKVRGPIQSSLMLKQYFCIRMFRRR